MSVVAADGDLDEDFEALALWKRSCWMSNQEVRKTRLDGSDRDKDWSGWFLLPVKIQTSCPDPCKYSASLPIRSAATSLAGGQYQEMKRIFIARSRISGASAPQTARVNNDLDVQQVSINTFELLVINKKSDDVARNKCGLKLREVDFGQISEMLRQKFNIGLYN